MGVPPWMRSISPHNMASCRIASYAVEMIHTPDEELTANSNLATEAELGGISHFMYGLKQPPTTADRRPPHVLQWYWCLDLQYIYVTQVAALQCTRHAFQCSHIFVDDEFAFLISARFSASQYYMVLQLYVETRQDHTSTHSTSNNLHGKISSLFFSMDVIHFFSL